MVNKPKLNIPDVETTTTFTATGESLTINMTIPTKQFKDIFVTGTSVVDQQHNFTFSECIKKLEEKGFIVNNKSEFYMFLDHEQHHISMFIHKQDIKYHIYYGYISLELNELLTQTLKVLKEMEDEKI